jgi:hypothetical protein
MYEELPTAESLPATSTMGLRQCRGSDMSPASCRLQHKTNGSSIKAESFVNLADFFARKGLADFLFEALLDFLANGFTHSVCNILSYFNITNLPMF